MKKKKTEDMKVYMREYYQKNKKKLLAQSKARKAEDREENNEHARKVYLDSKTNNPQFVEKLKENARRWQKNNQERYKYLLRRYQTKNRAEINKKQNEKNKKKRELKKQNKESKTD